MNIDSKKKSNYSKVVNILTLSKIVLTTITDFVKRYEIL